MLLKPFKLAYIPGTPGQSAREYSRTCPGTASGGIGVGGSGGGSEPRCTTTPVYGPPTGGTGGGAHESGAPTGGIIGYQTQCTGGSGGSGGGYTGASLQYVTPTEVAMGSMATVQGELGKPVYVVASAAQAKAWLRLALVSGARWAVAYAIRASARPSAFGKGLFPSVVLSGNAQDGYALESVSGHSGYALSGDTASDQLQGVSGPVLLAMVAVRLGGTAPLQLGPTLGDSCPACPPAYVPAVLAPYASNVAAVAPQWLTAGVEHALASPPVGQPVYFACKVYGYAPNLQLTVRGASGSYVAALRTFVWADGQAMKASTGKRADYPLLRVTGQGSAARAELLADDASGCVARVGTLGNDAPLIVRANVPGIARPIYALGVLVPTAAASPAGPVSLRIDAAEEPPRLPYTPLTPTAGGMTASARLARGTIAYYRLAAAVTGRYKLRLSTPRCDAFYQPAPCVAALATARGALPEGYPQDYAPLVFDGNHALQLRGLADGHVVGSCGNGSGVVAPTLQWESEPFDVSGTLGVYLAAAMMDGGKATGSDFTFTLELIRA